MPPDFSVSASRRSFLKKFGAGLLTAPFVTQGLLARRSEQILRHASFGAGGMAWVDLSELGKWELVELVAIADVDLSRVVEAHKRFPRAKIYQDWRELLDKEHKNLDSVNVSIPDHMHAPAALAAMHLGKHVYCQKPLAHDLAEVRKLTETARAKKVVTQMGIQIHSSAQYRAAVVLIQAGAIGKVSEVHSWCPKSWGDPTPLPQGSDAVPEDFAWDLWLGVCPDRPFLGQNYYHPSNWRKRLDFGTGTFGDMGCHLFDPVFTALQLDAPLTVRSEGTAPNPWNWPLNSRIEYTFAGTPYTTDALKVTWYDGDQKPPAGVLGLLEGDTPPHTGSIFVGSQGALVLPHVAKPILYPDKKFAGLKFPDVNSGDHWAEFGLACLGRATTSTPFSYSGPLTEAVLLGSVACRFPKTTLTWNAAALSFDLAEANKFVRRDYRPGWAT